VAGNLFSRMVVGWSMDATVTGRLEADGLEVAPARRLEGSSDLVAHSDHGSRYASEHYRRRLSEERIACSVSRRGNCWDDAPMESFFATPKKERVHHEDYATRAGEGEHLRVHRGVLQPRPAALVGGVRRPAEYERTRNPTHR
jgi:putative transposase